MKQRTLNGIAQDKGEPKPVRSLATRLFGRRMKSFIVWHICKIPKATIIFVMFVRLSARQNWSAVEGF
jgi:hypothetical protein